MCWVMYRIINEWVKIQQLKKVKWKFSKTLKNTKTLMNFMVHIIVKLHLYFQLIPSDESKKAFRLKKILLRCLIIFTKKFLQAEYFQCHVCFFQCIYIKLLTICLHIKMLPFLFVRVLAMQCISYLSCRSPFPVFTPNNISGS